MRSIAVTSVVWAYNGPTNIAIYNPLYQTLYQTLYQYIDTIRSNTLYSACSIHTIRQQGECGSILVVHGREKGRERGRERGKKNVDMCGTYAVY